MLKSLIFVVIAGSMAMGTVCAQQAKLVVPVTKTPANSGTQMYVNFCAPCHGLDGKGNGPIAPALKEQPPDLSVLTRNNGGKFPATRVASVLHFGLPNPAHGTAQMPIWGPMFGDPNQSTLRISNLVDYVRDLQVK